MALIETIPKCRMCLGCFGTHYLHEQPVQSQEDYQWTREWGSKKSSSRTLCQEFGLWHIPPIEWIELVAMDKKMTHLLGRRELWDAEVIEEVHGLQGRV
jgi:hypothetical protein